MKKTIINYFILSIILFSLYGCGGSNSSSSPIEIKEEIQTGYLIDSPIKGVQYSTSSGEIKTTDENGTFQYLANDLHIDFSLGGLKFPRFILSNIHEDKKILPTDLAGVERDDTVSEAVTNMLQIIQTLDTDGNASNGIEIDSQITELFLDDRNISDINISDIELWLEDKNITRRIVSKIEARVHFQLTQKEVLEQNNTTPTLSDISINTAEDTPLTSTIIGNDSDGDILLFSKLSDPSHGSLVFDSNGTFTYTPNSNYYGNDSFTFKANDGTIDSNTSTVFITITSVNDTPIANAGLDQENILGATIKLNGSGSSDIDDDALSYIWNFTSVPYGSEINNSSFSNNTFMAPTFTPDRDGDYTIELIVDDGNSTDNDFVKIVIIPANTQPIADAGEDLNISVGSLVSLDGSNSIDNDNNDLTYKWSFTTLPDGSSSNLNETNISNPNFTPDINGTYEVQLIVNDGTIDSEPDTITIIASLSNTIPIANAGVDQYIDAGTSITLDGSRSYDSDEDNLTYLWSFSSVPDGSGITDNNFSNQNTQSPSFTPDIQGDYHIQLIVNDGTINSNSDSVVITALNTQIDGTDNDGDYIPDNIEAILGMDPSNDDENNNGIQDGLDTQDGFGDTFFDKQWHIRSLGTLTNKSTVATIEGNDLNLLEIYHSYMGFNSGSPIIVQVVDTGVDIDHEDLVSNIDLTRSYDYGRVGDPSSNYNGTHGTMVAGIIGARAFNGKGVRGIAPFVQIAGSNWLENQKTFILEKVWYSGVGANEIAVTNNSWGSYFNTSTIFEDIMESGTKDLRDGKGRIYVFAAGNDGYSYGNGNANLQYMLSNRYGIAVAALKNDNTRADYSTPGSNILVSGYSGNFYNDSPTISTTTIMGTSINSGTIDTQTTWDEDTNKNYTFIMNGTSSASPTVAASIALVLEACPSLTWRDVRYLLIKNGIQIDTNRDTWVRNGAGYWHSIDYGFGLVNPQGMINECSNSSYQNIAAEETISQDTTFDAVIPDDATSHSFSINIDNNISSIEWIEVTVDNNSSWASDYKVELISPSGTQTTLMTPETALYDDWMNGGFRLSSAAMFGESSSGTWIVRFTDDWDQDDGTLRTINLKIYGH